MSYISWGWIMGATTSNHNRAYKQGLTYSISYGFLGGSAHSRKLRSTIKGRGLKPAAKIEEADVIIAHSAGCWQIPNNASARLVIFIGMPLAQDNPGKIFRKANANGLLAAVSSFQLLSWTGGLFIDLYYAVKQPRHNWAIIRHAGQAKPSILPRASHVFITNRHDPWVQSKQLDQLLESKDWSFIELPGSHGDLWRHPEQYAPIISYYAGLLD